MGPILRCIARYIKHKAFIEMKTARMKDLGNIHKLPRCKNIPPGTLLYRGLGGTLEFPDRFTRADPNCATPNALGFLEYGFMSTTADLFPFGFVSWISTAVNGLQNGCHLRCCFCCACVKMAISFVRRCRSSTPALA